MPGTTLLKRVGALVVALATLIALPTHAAPAGAQLGPIWVGGSLTSGGTLTYRLNLTVTSPGTLTAKATLSGKHLRISFPALSDTPLVGVGVVESAPITIPANFQGTAVLRVSAKFNNQNLHAKAILITVTAPPPAAAQPILYDVGFNTLVTLNANIVPTNGLGQPLTYSWTQFQGSPVALSATNAAMPTFTTGSLTDFVALTDALGVVPFNTLEVREDNNGDLDSYGFQVVVSDGVNSATGNVLVRVASLSPGLTQVPVGVKTYLQAPASETNNSWTLLESPPGSAAVLHGTNTRTPWLQTDVEGNYVVQDNVSGTNVTVTAASFVGVSTCASCHGPNTAGQNVGLEDLVTPWSQTGHATMFQRGVDGFLDPSYNESCFFCHTVGYNKQAVPTNSCFGDVQASLSWTLSTPVQPGNYSTIPASLQNKANIQCESCHGPGSQHPGKPSLDAAACAPCHQENTTDNFRVGQWQTSPHFNTDDASVFSHAASSCATKCHNPEGFIANAKGAPLPTTPAIGKMTCAVCHDPHNTQMFPGGPTGAHQVRYYGTVTLDSGITLNGEGTSATCMSCHNGRSTAPATYVKSTSLPHESTATDILLGMNGVTNMQAVVSGVTNTIATATLHNSAHQSVAKCVNCHMFTGSNTVGDHTFSMTDRVNGADDLAACNQCHQGSKPVDDFDFIAIGAGDYDGDGTIDGVQTEVDGVLANLQTKMTSTGLVHLPGYPYWSGYTNDVTYPVIYAAQRTAVWNYQMIARDLSHGVHNTAYTVGLLQWSYTVLSTNTGGKAYLGDFPSATVLYH
jgi:hypothetical protein